MTASGECGEYEKAIDEEVSDKPAEAAAETAEDTIGLLSCCCCCMRS